jgi:ParB/RepB/Spo0J family partition protein
MSEAEKEPGDHAVADELLPFGSPRRTKRTGKTKKQRASRNEAEPTDENESEAAYYEYEEEFSDGSGSGKPQTQTGSNKEARRQIRRELGLDVPLRYEERVLPVASLVVPEEQTISAHSSRRFAENLSLLGMLHPVVVVPVHTTAFASPLYEVISGRRRVLAAREAGLSEISCRIYPAATNRAQVAALRLSENNRRSDNIIGDVLEIRALLQTNLVDEKHLATVLGLAPATIAKRLKLALLPDPIVEALQRGELSPKLALEITRLSASQQEELALSLEMGETVTAEEVRELGYARASRNLTTSSLQSAFALDWQAEAGAAGEKTGSPASVSPLPAEVNSTQDLMSEEDEIEFLPTPGATASGSNLKEALQPTNTERNYREQIERIVTELTERVPDGQSRALHNLKFLAKALVAELDNLLRQFPAPSK